MSHHQPSGPSTTNTSSITITTNNNKIQEQAGTSSTHAARSFAASRPPGLPPCSSQRGSAVRGPPPTVTQGERTEDSHKLASDPVQKEPGACRESKLQAGDGSVDAIGTSDLIPRAAGRGVLKCDCTHHLTQGWRPSRYPNPGVRESHCGHGSKPPGLEPTRHSPNSPLTGNVVEAKSQRNEHGDARTHDENQQQTEEENTASEGDGGELSPTNPEERRS